jgi:hypothetical protein
MGTSKRTARRGGCGTVMRGARTDRLVRARAAAVRDLGRPVLLRWFWEMDRAAKA